jgi:glycosyltransferase involved in cell wall biosynthesis
MNILLVCTKFSEDAATGWLTNDLAAALDAAGHTIDVIHHQWTGEGPPRLSCMYGNVTVLSSPAWNAVPRWLPRQARKLLQWVWSSQVTARLAQRMLPTREYDLLIGCSPAVVTGGIVRVYRRKAAQTCLIYWDFFPVAYVQAKSLPGGRYSAPLAHWLETRALALYDRVGCMSPANIDFFRRYFSRYRGQIFHLPVWGPNNSIDTSRRNELRQEFGITDIDVVCVFGGQFVPGRGIENICNLAARAQQHSPHVKFLLAGSGSLLDEVVARTKDSTNMRYLGQFTRERYADLLAASDIGLVVTSLHGRVPTFPSKTIDYFRAGLPVLGAVEDFGDYSTIITHEIRAGLSCAALDTKQLDANLHTLAHDKELREACGARGKNYYFTHMTADSIMARLLSTTSQA